MLPSREMQPEMVQLQAQNISMLQQAMARVCSQRGSRISRQHGGPALDCQSRRVARLQDGIGLEERDAALGAEWQLSSSSQKALRTSRSSSLVSLLLVHMLSVTISDTCIAVHLKSF